MLPRLFAVHGQLCASHPWEALVVVASLTMSVHLWAPSNKVKVCGWNLICIGQEELTVSDMIMLTLTRGTAVTYLYLQLRNLRKLGYKYLLGLAGMLTILSSFIISITIASLVGLDLSGISELLPVFLLLVNLSKAGALAEFTLTGVCQLPLEKTIGKGIAAIGPATTLDTIVKALAVGVGTLSGVKHLETLCGFGCLSIVASYLAFMIVFPACLSLILEVSHGHHEKYQQLGKTRLEEEDEKKANPVTQRIKIIMSVGLVFVHAHSRLVAGTVAKQDSSLNGVNLLQQMDGQRVHPRLPLWQFYVSRFLTSDMDYGLTLVLAICLAIKYVFFDDPVEEAVKALVTAQNVPENCVRPQSTSARPRFECHVTPKVNKETDDQKPTFFLGEQDIVDRQEDDDDEVSLAHKGIQTDICTNLENTALSESLSHYSHQESNTPPRCLQDCLLAMNSDDGLQTLTDEEVKMLVRSKHIPAYQLENQLADHTRAVAIRRQLLADLLPSRTVVDSLPYLNYNYQHVDGACCENVIGYIPVPVGVVGPLLLDGMCYHVPMATTEGCLVASTNRGCRALEQSGGVRSTITNDGMTRGPVIRFPTAVRASQVKEWLEQSVNFDQVKKCFDATSRFARLKKLQICQAGKSLYIRFQANTGDAMGMNMLSKGCEQALSLLTQIFTDMEIVSLSGNYCTDKKPAAINWIEGRGKSVVCEAVVKSHIVTNILKTTTAALVELNISKNLVGSAMAGSIGGFNAHASNIVTAVFIATGQDPAQNITSSNCITLMEAMGPLNDDLHISCTMPSIEVGTVGGGTVLLPQSACLEMLGVKGADAENPGENARRLARIICATVMAGELSLMSALASGHLVRSHLKHNRSTINMAPEAVIAKERLTFTHSVTSPCVLNTQ